MGDKVRLYKRPNSNYWQCATFLSGKKRRTSTKTESLAEAKDFAEDWYLSLRGLQRSGDLHNEKSFADAAEQFMQEYEVLTEGERNERWVKDHYRRLRLHLLPFFGSKALSKITPGMVQEYRIKRMKPDDPDVRIPSRSTLHHEIVTLRLVLKTAVRHEWLTHVPDVSEPFKGSAKVTHRAWFSPEEYSQLYHATRENIKKAKNSRHKFLAEQLHDKILFMANSGIRPDEANCLQYRDVEVVFDEALLEGDVVSVDYGVLVSCN